MSPGMIDEYIGRLERELRRRGLDDPRILAEAREHLADAVEEGRQRGLSVDEAEQEALERFGAPAIVAAAHADEERSRMTGFSGALGRAWQRKWWILVPTVAAAIATSVASNYLPTRYRADVRMIVVSNAQSAVALTSDAADFERSIEALLSRNLLEAVIRDTGLYREKLDRVRMSDLIEQMRGDISITSLTPAPDGPPWPPRAVRAFEIGFAAADPEQAKQVTERLASVVIDENLKQEAKRVGSATRSLELQIEEVREELVKQEKKMKDLRAAAGGRALSPADLIPYDAVTEQYKALSARLIDAKVAEAVKRRQIGEQFRIIDAATVPETPDGPGRLRVTLIGALIGLLLGLALVMFRRPSSGVPPTLAEA